MATITVNGNTIDPESTNYVSPNARDSNFIYIQGHQVLSIDEKLQLLNLGVEIQEYVSENTYLCRYEPADLEQLRALPYVRSANIYHAELKSTSALKETVDRENDRTEYRIDVILHDSPNVDCATLAPEVAEKAGVNVTELKVFSNKIRLTVNQDKLGDIASLDSVNRIEQVLPNRVFNDEARAILQADTILQARGYQGAGQTVCVADTGFDQGFSVDTSTTKIHPAFSGRVADLVSLWIKDGSANPAKDVNGHGTHVSGSICGNGSYNDSVKGKISVKGTAPAAKLMMQSLSIWDEDEKAWGFKVPGDVALGLLSSPYTQGVRIHSNSWGPTWPGYQVGYEANATGFDKFVFERPDFVAVVAAGNDASALNAGVSQIGGNGTAKNCITVGATGTSRPNDGRRFQPDTTVARQGPNDTGYFSSKGPTRDTGRIKPDVAAPGVIILSTASRAVAADAKVRTNFGVSNDDDWMFLSGTSMATPLISGCVALLREALLQQGKTKPSAALIKALLVNGAVNYSAQNGATWDYNQGFGRVDINSSIDVVKQATFVDGGYKLETTKFDVPTLRLVPAAQNKWESPAITIPSTGKSKLVATLAYPDEQGSLLQNDVNLIVQAGAVERHGNVGTDAGFDQTNNVERVIWDNIPSGAVKVIVQASAFTKPQSEQPFSVVWKVTTTTE
ncbi:MAG: hypothetical protein M1814_006708 [Vezdaea aestivalis]|nr:MAG: hypothetical protein M1814_006708 [Vezdaea aestivalis]